MKSRVRFTLFKIGLGGISNVDDGMARTTTHWHSGQVPLSTLMVTESRRYKLVLYTRVAEGLVEPRDSGFIQKSGLLSKPWLLRTYKIPQSRVRRGLESREGKATFPRHIYPAATTVELARWETALKTKKIKLNIGIPQFTKGSDTRDKCVC